jgi:hypothetical protein
MAGVEHQIKALRTYCDGSLVAMEKASDLLRDQQNDRFANSNEWRGQLSDQLTAFETRMRDQNAQFVPKVELKALLDAINSRADLDRDRIGGLEKVASNIEGRFYAIGVAMFLFNVAVIVLLKFVV